MPLDIHSIQDLITVLYRTDSTVYMVEDVIQSLCTKYKTIFSPILKNRSVPFSVFFEKNSKFELELIGWDKNESGPIQNQRAINYFICCLKGKITAETFVQLDGISRFKKIKKKVAKKNKFIHIKSGDTPFRLLNTNKNESVSLHIYYDPLLTTEESIITNNDEMITIINR